MAKCQLANFLKQVLIFVFDIEVLRVMVFTSDAVIAVLCNSSESVQNPPKIK